MRRDTLNATLMSRSRISGTTIPRPDSLKGMHPIRESTEIDSFGPESLVSPNGRLKHKKHASAESVLRNENNASKKDSLAESVQNESMASMVAAMEGLQADFSHQRELLEGLRVQQKVDTAAASLQTRRATVSGLTSPNSGAATPRRSSSVAGSSKRLLAARFPGNGNFEEGDPGVDFDAGEETNPAAAGLEEAKDRDWGGDGEDGLTALGIGDIISLTLSDVGLLVGDVCLNRLGVEEATVVGGGGGGSGGAGAGGGGGQTLKGRAIGAGAPESCAFRLCPKLNYRARREMKRLEWTRKQQDKVDRGGDSGGGRGAAQTTLARLLERLDHERHQNEELMKHVRSRGKITPVLYGDIVQLEHVASRQFVGMLASPAPLNTNNHTVALLKRGLDGNSCHFRVVPRFKVRSLGSKVFSDDEAVLESVKFEGFVLSASTNHAFQKALPSPAALVPRVLRNPRTLELSGWLLRRGPDGKPVTHTHMAKPLVPPPPPQQPPTPSSASQPFLETASPRGVKTSGAGTPGGHGGHGGHGLGVHQNQSKSSLKFPATSAANSRGGSFDAGQSHGAWHGEAYSEAHVTNLKGGGVEGEELPLSEEYKCVASFQLKLFARFRPGDASERITSFSKVRFFDPEFNGYLSASTNRDKGELLDALPHERNASGGALRLRAGGARGHCAYLKPLSSVSDPSNAANLSAKAVWRFEPVEELTAGVVSFNEPLRLRHAATNLFLAVDLAKPAVKAQQPARRRLSTCDEPSEPPFFDCFLTDGKASAWEAGGCGGGSGGGGDIEVVGGVSADAMIFRIVPTDEEDTTLKQGFTTIRIEHRTSDGQRLFMSDIDDAKPRFPSRNNDGNRSSDGSGGSTTPKGDTSGAFLQETAAAAGRAVGGPRGKDSAPGTAPRCRIGFVGRLTGLEAIEVRPVFASECEALDAVMSFLEVVNLYAHRYQTATRSPDDLPVDACEELVAVLLDLLDLLHKGTPAERRHKTIADHMTEANKMQAPHFSAMNFGGEVDPKIQTLCFETKLLDALFAAALAPYNRQHFQRGGVLLGPFDSKVTKEQPAAAQKFIYLCIQRICFNNEAVMSYFARASASVWRLGSSGEKVRETEPWRNLLVDQAEDGFGAIVLLAQLFKSSSTILKKLVNDDLMERFKQLIKKVGPEVRLINLFSSTCFVRGRPMRGFQEACIRKLWMNPVDRYSLGVTFHETTADAVVNCFRGLEHLRFPFGALSTEAQDDTTNNHAENAPRHASKCDSRAQRASRGLSMAFGRTRAWVNSGDASKRENRRHSRQLLHGGHTCYPAGVDPPENYLGKRDTHVYPPVAVVWHSSRAVVWGSNYGEKDRQGLYWSPEQMNIPSLDEFFYPKGLYPESEKYLGELVPIELLMWVLEPGRLCRAVTGEPFVKFVTAAEARTANYHNENPHEVEEDEAKEYKSPENVATSIFSGERDSKSMRRRMSDTFRHQEAAAEVFTRKQQFTLYIIDQINLLTQMCKGRCVNAISHLEPFFSYALLMNMASNPLLPYRFRAAIVHFSLALYVDRYPQIPKCGATELPERLWIFEDKDDTKTGHKKKSTITIVNSDLTLQHEAAFPGFFVSPSSMAYGKADPVDENSFFLLRSLCNDLLQTNHLVYDDLSDGGFNTLTAALLTAQSYLLEFGFQSTVEKIKEMCKPNATILDGRRDLVQPGKAFTPSTRRYNDMGFYSEAVVGIKRAIIDEFFDLADLRVNYRLALILGFFKSKLKGASYKKRHSWMGADLEAIASKAATATGYVAETARTGQYTTEEITEWALSYEVYAMFEGLFQEVLPSQYDDDDSDDTFGGGGLAAMGMHVPRHSQHDAHTLEFSKLSGKEDFEDVLLDTLLYDNDRLFGASLHLLEINYSMRKRLVYSLDEAVLLQNPRIAVCGEVHTLRSNINELSELISTHTVWGVHSVVSGDFDQSHYSRLMSVVDMLLEFIYTPELETGDYNLGGSNLDNSTSSSPSYSSQDTRGNSLLDDSLLDDSTGPSNVDLKPLPGTKSTSTNKKEDTQTRWGSSKRKTTKAGVTARRTTVFINALQEHFKEHPAYDTNEELRCHTFFSKMDEDSNGLLKLDDLNRGIRNLLNISNADLNCLEIEHLFNAMSEGRDVNFNAFEVFVLDNGDKANHAGCFFDCDKSPDGTYFRADHVYSVDVAAKWLDRTRPLATKIATASNASAEAAAACAHAAATAAPSEEGTVFGAAGERSASSMWKYTEVAATGGRGVAGDFALKPCTYHQDILRGCNLAQTLSEAILIDPDIAFRGSNCTVGLKVESQRRLTLVTRALFMLYKAFVANNQNNQNMMFKDWKDLKCIGTPIELGGGDMDNGYDERVPTGGPRGHAPLRVEERHHSCFKVAHGEYGESRSSGGSTNDSTSAPKGPRSSGGSANDSTSAPKGHQQEEPETKKVTPSQKQSRPRPPVRTPRGLKSPTESGWGVADDRAAATKSRKAAGMTPTGTGGPSKRREEYDAIAPSRAWPTTLEEMAQDIMISLLRGNEVLCLRLAEDEKQRDACFDLFASVANKHGQHEERGHNDFAHQGLRRPTREPRKTGEVWLTSCDTSPALDFFFVMCAPTQSRPLADFQIRVAERLSDFSRFDALARSCTSCVRRVRNKTMNRESSSGGIGNKNELPQFSLGPEQTRHENPYRMVRLLKACCQGGNDKAAILLASASALIGVEECCEVLLSHFRVALPCDPAASVPVSVPASSKQAKSTNSVPVSLDPQELYVTNGDDILRILAPPSRFSSGVDNGVMTASRRKAASRRDTRVTDHRANLTSSRGNNESDQGQNVSGRPGSLSKKSKSFFVGKKKRSTSTSHLGKATETDSSTDGVVVGAAAATALESFENGGLLEHGAFEVLALLVDLVDLLPLSAPQLKAPLLWEFVGVVMVPAINTLARHRGVDASSPGNTQTLHTASERIVCAEFVDLLDRVLARAEKHNLIDDLLAEQYRHGLLYVDEIRDDLRHIVTSHPTTLGKLLSGRSREAAQRIFLRCEDMGNSILVPKYSRKDPHVYSKPAIAVPNGFSWIAKEANSIKNQRSRFKTRNKFTKGSSRKRTSSGEELTSGTALLELLKAQNKETPHRHKHESSHLEATFRAFQLGLKFNPHIKMAILRRRFELLTVLELGSKPDPKQFPNAVQVTWEMLVSRFIRYARKPVRFNEDTDPNDHSGLETCQIILKLLRDHLVKARTLPLNNYGNVVVDPLTHGRRVYDHPRVTELRTLNAMDLPHYYFTSFVRKQHTLVRLGCVEMAARIVMVADSTSADGDLADEALEVLDELNHDGDLKVRRVLFDHLIAEDNEGRFLSHLVVRMENANATLREGRSFGLLGCLGSNMTEDIQLAVSNSRQTVQYLSHLCMGHHTEFQNLLREQPMYNVRTYDLVGMCIELLCSMADSQQAVKFMSAEELGLMRDLLLFLCHCQEGPNVENQSKVAQSDLPVAINLIVAAESPIDARLTQQEGKGRVTLDGLCFRVVAACLEGRTDTFCHERLKDHLEMGVLYEKARSLDSKCRVAIMKSKTNYFFETPRLTDTAQLLADIGSLAHIWTINKELFSEMSEPSTRRRLIGRAQDLRKYFFQSDNQAGASSVAESELAEAVEAAAAFAAADAGDGGGRLADGGGTFDGTVNGAGGGLGGVLGRGGAGRVSDGTEKEGGGSSLEEKLFGGDARRSDGTAATQQFSQSFRKMVKITKQATKVSKTVATAANAVSATQASASAALAATVTIPLSELGDAHLNDKAGFQDGGESDTDEEGHNGEDHDGEEGLVGAEQEGGSTAQQRWKLVGSVEVAWKGKTHRVCFPMPLEARMLTSKTKQLFLEKTRLATTDKRQDSLFLSSDLFIAEMDWVHHLAQRSRLSRLIGRHLSSLKLFMYSLVVLLNVNVLMSPPSLSKPFSALFSAKKYANLKPDEKFSLYLTFALGAVNFVGYFVIMGYVAITTVPIMICETDKIIARDRKSLDPNTKGRTNLSAFKWWFVTLIFNVMFIVMHTTNFPSYRGSSSLNLYLFLVLGINLPWTLSCLRNFIVVPANRFQRVFILVFDALVAQPFLRNHLVLQVLSAMGFTNSEYFTLMLFDILNNSHQLANVTKAVMAHFGTLVLVFYLFLATTISYASFGLEFFPEDFVTTHNGETKTFKTTLSAFWFLFYNFSSRGVLKGAIAEADPKSDNWLFRIFFDTAYFVWVGIILFTTITALLVDSLRSARTEAALREAEEKNVCFMCGLKRDDYDDFSLAPGSPSFDDHCSKEHDPWAYVAFAAHLTKKRSSECTGMEAYVKRALAKNETLWVPSKTSFVLEEQGAVKGKSGALLKRTSDAPSRTSGEMPAKDEHRSKAAATAAALGTTATALGVA